jgi:hypothetical protein
VRTVDRAARRHRYGVGEIPRGELAGEVGALLHTEPPGGIPVWITPRGELVTDRYRPGRARPSVRRAGRWTLAPLAWSSSTPIAPRARASARRAAQASTSLALPRRRPPRPSGPPAGWLLPTDGPGRRPLISAIHPVTGDQLVTTWAIEATDMGYESLTVLGYILGSTPTTGRRDFPRVSVPWASRFGLEVRRA